MLHTKSHCWHIQNRGNLLVQVCSSILAHLLQILTAASWAHGSRIILVECFVALLQLNPWVFSGYDDGAAGLSGAETGTLEVAAAGIIAVDAGCGGGGCGCVGGLVRVRGEDGDGGVGWCW